MAAHKLIFATILQRMAVASTSFCYTRCYTAHHATATATLNPSNRACQMRQQKEGTATTSQTVQLFFTFSDVYTVAFSHEALACTCNACCTTPNTSTPGTHHSQNSLTTQMTERHTSATLPTHHQHISTDPCRRGASTHHQMHQCNSCQKCPLHAFTGIE